MTSPAKENINALSKVVIYNDVDHPTDITTIVSGLEIIESIDQPLMVGHMTVIDGANILSTLGIVDSGWVEVVIFDAFHEEYSIFTFSIVTMQPSKDSKGLSAKNTEIWNIIFMSDEYANDEVPISRALSGTSKTTSDIVIDMIRNELHSEKDIHVEPTDTRLDDYRANNITPLSVCYSMSPRSFSAANPLGSLYFFFENIDGFHFKSLELLTGPKGQENAIRYKASCTMDADADYRAFQQLEFGEIGNNIKAIISGAAGSTVSVLNPDSKQVTNNEYDPNKDGPSNLAEDDPTTRLHKGLKAHYKTLVVDSPNNSTAAMSRRKATLANLLSCINANGSMDFSFDIKTGGIIDVYNPRDGEPESGDSGIDKHLYSGPFLITAVRHTFTQNTSMTTVSLVKNMFNMDPMGSYKELSETE